MKPRGLNRVCLTTRMGLNLMQKECIEKLTPCTTSLQGNGNTNGEKKPLIIKRIKQLQKNT